MGKFSRFRLPVLVLLLPILGSLAGCSVFGIATKGDLSKQNEVTNRELTAMNQTVDGRLNSMQQSLDSELAGITGTLQAMEQELNTTIADLDGRSQANADELADMQLHFQMIQGQVQLALADLESVAAAASRAEAESKQAVQLQHDAQLAEREHLRSRLQELDAVISSWLPTTVPSQQLQPQLQPEHQTQSAVATTDQADKLPRPGLQIPESARRGDNH